MNMLGVEICECATLTPAMGLNCQARAGFQFFFSFFILKAVFALLFLFRFSFGSPSLAVLRPF